VILAALGAATLAVIAGGAGGGPAGNRFTVELDNAFGLTVGSDLKVAGVRAGTIRDIRLDDKTHDALVDIEVTKTGFGSLRTDAFCESRPQSLIGEYYLDCAPGTDPKKLADDARIPIEQTGSTVPADLLADVMRMPYRERLRVILSQLGVGLSARGEELNEAIRRASPALRETDRVLAILAEQNATLRRLVTDADTVLADLAGNREDVGRWVREARATAADSATRRAEIAASLNRLPAFLRELRPTMADLGRTADAQGPALADLDASAQRLETLFTQLDPFARASQVNLRSLGATSQIGRDAAASARPVVALLDRFSRDTPELAQNLRIVLHDLDDRDRAIEADPRSPGGDGYTGFEALLQYTFDQSMAINIFDTHGYILKANLFESECSDFQNEESIAEKMAEDPGFIDRCAAWLGPNQLGVIQPDPTKPSDARSEAAPRRARVRPDAGGRRDRRQGAAPDGPAATPVPVSGTGVPGVPVPTVIPGKPLVPLIDQTLDNLVPQVNTNANPEDLLDFLLAP
jgi:phospholipid/cholesterol/gamma-HCH transport system substrate-binding protein